MKHPLRTTVKVTSMTDDTMDERCLNKEGYVIIHNSNGMTGNTEKDPLHIVVFTDGTTESFWYEELTPIKC